MVSQIKMHVASVDDYNLRRCVKKTTTKNSKNLTVLLNVSQIILGKNRSAMIPTCRESKCVCVGAHMHLCVKSMRLLLRSENSSLNSFVVSIDLLVLSMYNVTITDITDCAVL